MRTIREELDGLPPLGDVDRAVRDAGRSRGRWAHARTGLTLAAAAVTVAFVAGGAVYVADQLSEPAPVAGNVSAESADPAEIEKAMSTAAASAGPREGWPKSSVSALDAQDQVIQGEDRVHATRWQGVFSASDREELRVILINESPLTLDEASKDCALRLEAGHAVSCEASSRGGAVVQQITRGAQTDPDGWPVVPVDQFKSQGSDLWLMQQVILRDPSGTTVYVSEVARATTWEQAASRWVVDDTGLLDLAENVNLPIADQTGWVARS